MIGWEGRRVIGWGKALRLTRDDVAPRIRTEPRSESPPVPDAPACGSPAASLSRGTRKLALADGLDPLALALPSVPPRGRCPPQVLLPPPRTPFYLGPILCLLVSNLPYQPGEFRAHVVCQRSCDVARLRSNASDAPRSAWHVGARGKRDTSSCIGSYLGTMP